MNVRWLLAVTAALNAVPTTAVPARLQTPGERWTETGIAREAFDNNWRKRWILEGNAELSVRRGRLHVASPEATLWWHQPLPADAAIELIAGVDGPADDNAANLNLILHARELDGAPYRFGRSAKYEEYHALPNYIATLTGGFQPGWARLRRNPGFAILSENTSIRAEAGRTYRIKLLVAEGRLRYWLDGRLVHDVVDPRPLTGGHFALRTWRSRVWWSDIRFASVRRATSPGDRLLSSVRR
jgi:hypothetical protein